MSLSRILRKPKGNTCYTADNRWVLPNQLIGYEAEYEGVTDRFLPDHTYANHFVYHAETSLKDAGAEFVFTQPLFGADSWNAIHWLTSYAAEQKWKCTKRTGIHIHLDVRDLEVNQLTGLCLLYAALEPIIYRWIGGSRETSHFCIPLYKADDTLLKVCKIIRSAYGDEKAGTNNAVKIAESMAEERYAGLNPNSLAKFGTLEFRHLETTHKFDRIVDWINIIMSLKATAYKLPQSDGSVIRLIEQLGTKDLLDFVFPGPLVRQLYTEESSRLIFEVGIPSARDIAVHGCQPLSWEKFQFPKGEHGGFAKWIKSAEGNRQEKGKKHEELVVFDDFNDMDEELDEPPIQAPPLIEEPLFQNAQNIFWGNVNAPIEQAEVREAQAPNQEQLARAWARLNDMNRGRGEARIVPVPAPRPRR